MGRTLGWHFYTRMVQLKFLKDCLKINKYLKLDEEKIKKLQSVVDNLFSSLEDHICENEDGKYIISSFSKDGKITKYEDAANMLAYCHIDYDQEILDKLPLRIYFTYYK